MCLAAHGEPWQMTESLLPENKSGSSSSGMMHADVAVHSGMRAFGLRR